MLTEVEAIQLATERLKKIYPQPELLKANHSDELEEFPGHSGWRVWFSVDDPDFGPYDRPVEVEETTCEAGLVNILL